MDRRIGFGLACVVCAVTIAGCGRGGTAQREEQAYRDAGLAKLEVAEVSGNVTVDGGAPAAFTVVMLWDPKHPDAGVLRAICDSDGHFAFSTYKPGDGVPPGSYVALFGQFNPSRRLGEFEAPDMMHNLYNDPEKNASKPEFLINVAAPGKSDYQFDLSTAESTPVTNPGPHAVTELKFGT
jgi:hypothetical protein